MGRRFAAGQPKTPGTTIHRVPYTSGGTPCVGGCPGSRAFSFSPPPHVDGMLFVADYDDRGHSDRIVIWRPADVTTPVVTKSWTDVRRAYRGR